RFAQTGIHQLMDVQPHGLSRVGCQVENAGVHPDCILRTNLHAIPAIDADAEIDVEPDRVLLDVGVGMLARYDGDALGRTDGLAQHAPYAAWSVILALGEAVPAAESRHERPPLLGKLNGRRGRKVLQVAEQVGRVEKEIAEEVGKRDLEATENLRHVEL